MPAFYNVIYIYSLWTDHFKVQAQVDETMKKEQQRKAAGIVSFVRKAVLFASCCSFPALGLGSLALSWQLERDFRSSSIRRCISNSLKSAQGLGPGGAARGPEGAAEVKGQGDAKGGRAFDWGGRHRAAPNTGSKRAACPGSLTLEHLGYVVNILLRHRVGT